MLCYDEDWGYSEYPEKNIMEVKYLSYNVLSEDK